MKKKFRSLRWRLVGALGVVILLTVLLSGALALWTTTNRFDILVTDESRQQAQALAPLLEASYAYWGDWRGLDDLLNISVATSMPDEIFAPDWYSDVDWWAIVTRTLHLDEEALWAQWDELGSLAAIAEQQGIAPEQITQAIIAAEQAAVDAAVANDELSPEQAANTMAWVKDAASTFVNNETSVGTNISQSWEEIIAGELNLSLDEVYAILDNGLSIADRAIQQGMAPEHLVKVIVAAEEAALRESGQTNAQEIQGYVFQVESVVWDMIDPESRYRPNLEFSLVLADGTPTWTAEGINWLINAVLLGDQRLLVADRDGWVVYDSTYKHTGQQLSEELLAQGVALQERAKDEFIGTVIVAAGPGYYDTRQIAFLRSVTRSLIISGLVGGLVALLIGLAIARQVIAPVTALTTATRRLADGDWNERLHVRSEDELGQMSAAFNEMVDQLQVQRRLRRRLVNDVAHELNTPLSIIQLEIEALTDGLQSPAEAATALRQEIDLLRNLVGDLEVLAETDAGQISLDARPTNINDLAQEAAFRWQARAQVRDIALTVALAGNLPLVLADADRIQQVLGNLLSNALRHTPAGGRVTIITGRAEREEAALVQVRDTGEGIAAEDLPHVFERFYRTDRSRSRHTGGRGLGLAIVKQIVTLHGGRVWVESAPSGPEEQGSVFSFTLPLASEK